MQALYQWQLNNAPPADLLGQYLEGDAAVGVDREYFTELVNGCTANEAAFRELIVTFIDRPLEQLDPIERAIMMIGIFELRERLDVPYRVVINEAVDLCKRFGATDAHKYINAVLDRASRALRVAEQSRG
jgi:transcription antitermination protein NusB